MKLIYLAFSFLGLLAFIIAALLKGDKIKQNLFFVFTGSILVGTSYLLTPLGINGAVSSYIGAAQAIINYIFNSKNRTLPIWLILIYVFLFVCINLAVINSPIGILALFASLCFIGSISAKNGKSYRIWQIINNSLWIFYDFLSHSYGPLATHSVLLLFTLIGVWINDLKIKQNI